MVILRTRLAAALAAVRGLGVSRPERVRSRRTRPGKVPASGPERATPECAARLPFGKCIMHYPGIGKSRGAEVPRPSLGTELGTECPCVRQSPQGGAPLLGSAPSAFEIASGHGDEAPRRRDDLEGQRGESPAQAGACGLPSLRSLRRRSYRSLRTQIRLLKHLMAGSQAGTAADPLGRDRSVSLVSRKSRGIVAEHTATDSYAGRQGEAVAFRRIRPSSLACTNASRNPDTLAVAGLHHERIGYEKGFGSARVYLDDFGNFWTQVTRHLQCRSGIPRQHHPRRVQGALQRCPASELLAPDPCRPAKMVEGGVRRGRASFSSPLGSGQPKISPPALRTSRSSRATSAAHARRGPRRRPPWSRSAWRRRGRSAPAGWRRPPSPSARR